MEASGAGFRSQAGGSRAAKVESRETGQGGVARQDGGAPGSGPARGVEIDGGGTRGAAATNNGAGVLGHHGTNEGPDAALNAQQSGLGAPLPAGNEDHVERLLQRRLAAERELKVVGGPLIFSAAILIRSIFRAQTRPPAWVSKALQSGEEYYRASLYNNCNILAFNFAFATFLVLCLYHLKDHLEVPGFAERVLTTVRVTMSLTLIFMAMSFSVGLSEDWRGAAATFLTIVTGPVIILFLKAIGKL